MPRSTLLPIAGVLALALVTPAVARAQACLGLPSRAHTSAALAFEGTDGLTGRSAALMHGRPGWGLQLRAERYDDQPVWRGAWYGAEVQVSRALHASRASSAAGSGTSAAANRLCATVAGRYQHDANRGTLYQRLRAPVGVAWGHALVAARATPAGPPVLTVTPFVQPQLLLQHERLRTSGDVQRLTRTRVAPAATFGMGAAAGPGFVRTAIQYAALPDETLNGRHNWFELTLQVGLTF